MSDVRICHLPVMNSSSPYGTGFSHGRLSACLVAVLAVASAPALPADDAAPVPPGYRELWVPSAQLDTALRSLPRAVLLTPDEFQSLTGEALQPAQVPAESPPIPIVMRDLSFEGTVIDGVTRMEASYTVQSLSDGWTEIPLPMPITLLAGLTVDERGALRILREQKKDAVAVTSVLAVRGAGTHRIRAVFHLPVERGPLGESIRFTTPASPVSRLSLHLPSGARANSSLPFTQEGDLVRFALPAQGGGLQEISWSAREAGDIPGAAILQTCRYLYSVDSSRVSADLGFVLNRDLAALPPELSITLPPNTRVLSVEGTELLGWTLVDGVIQVRLIEGRHVATDLRILAELDITLPTDGSDAEITLPQPEVQGVHRASGTFALFGSEDTQIKRILTSPLTVTAPEQIDAAVREAPYFVAGFSFPATLEAPKVALARVSEKFNAQLDSLIQLKRDAVFIDRTLTVVPVEGRVFETVVRLPEGEEVLSVTLSSAEGNAAPPGSPDWSRDGTDPRLLHIPWPGGLALGENRTLLLSTRRDPTGWYALGNTPVPLDFASLAVPGADALSGYVAVQFDRSFRVETQTATSLEPRDGRTTPVEGALAWFRLRDYALQLSVSRRPTEIDATVTAYAVPLQGTLEIEGQIDAEIRHTAVPSVKIHLPVNAASQLRFDSPLIAEKHLDAVTGEWTLVFHEERLGPLRLRFHLSTPFATESEDSKTADKTFQVPLPVISLVGTRRQTGHWILEANTDTELTFQPKGLDPVDSLQVPPVEGYQPRHRVIAAYLSRGDAWSLGISGTRHPSASLVSTVIEDLLLDSVASTDGPLRHQLLLQVRSAGDQFLDFGLPAGARLWALTLDGSTSKPVASSAGSLRIQLPARDGNAAPYRIKLIYETSGAAWRGSGTARVEPPRFSEAIPVLRTRWRLHLPEGYDFQRFESNLRAEFRLEDRTLLGAAGQWLGDPGSTGRGNLARLVGTFDSLFFDRLEVPLGNTAMEQRVAFAYDGETKDGLSRFGGFGRANGTGGEGDDAKSEGLSILKRQFFGDITLKGDATSDFVAVTAVPPTSAPALAVAQKPRQYRDTDADEVMNGNGTVADSPAARPAREGENALRRQPDEMVDRAQIKFLNGSTEANVSGPEPTLTDSVVSERKRKAGTSGQENEWFEQSDKEKTRIDAYQLNFGNSVAGLVPLDFQLPESGRQYAFSGLHAPGGIDFHYVNWERQVRLAWLWMVFGAVGFGVAARRWFRKPLLSAALGVVVLSLGPLAAGGWLLIWCNAVLLGWIVGAVGWFLWRRFWAQSQSPLVPRSPV